MQGAATIRYRRFIKPFKTFHITTKIVYWDEQSIFMEHRFVGKDDFVHAIAFCRQRLINCSAEHVMEILLTRSPAAASNSMEKLENGDLKMKPEMPLEVSLKISLLVRNFLKIFNSSRCKSGMSQMRYRVRICEALKVLINNLFSFKINV